MTLRLGSLSVLWPKDNKYRYFKNISIVKFCLFSSTVYIIIVLNTYI